MSDLTLHVGNKNYSSWSLRAWLALRHAGVPFRTVVLSIAGDDAGRDAIKRVSPSGRVPVLKQGDLIVWDSLAIAEMVAETWPDAGLWPEDPAARAVARACCAEMHSGFSALRSELPMNIRRRVEEHAHSDAAQADITRITQAWGACRQRFAADGPFLFGKFSIADAFFAPVVSRFRTYGVPLDDASAEYAEAVWGLPAMREWCAAAAAEPATIPKYDVA